MPDFWKSLSIFWGEDQIYKWKHTLFPNGVGIDRCFNLISLSNAAHSMWNRGAFALKPLNLSRDRKRLTVQFFWQVVGEYEMNSEVDLLTEPSSSEGLNRSGKKFLQRLWDDGSFSQICSGDKFTFTTKDPKKLPLPSLELLKMQWILQRLVGMCGAAEWPSLDDIDNDSVDNDDNPAILDYFSAQKSFKRVSEWVDVKKAASFTPETATTTPGPTMIECH
jgi:HNH endonuclease